MDALEPATAPWCVIGIGSGKRFARWLHVGRSQVFPLIALRDAEFYIPVNLFARRVRESEGFVTALDLKGLSDKAIFDRIFPRQVDQGPGKATTWSRMMSRIRDGNGTKPPRNLIDLTSKARDAQLRSESRSPRQYVENISIVEADALRRARRALSEQRVQDTLLAEAADFVPLIERFRGGKAEHNEESLSALLSVDQSRVRTTVKPLIEMGFLEEVGDSFKVPMLYRDGLEITQGKAFLAGQEGDETNG